MKKILVCMLAIFFIVGCGKKLKYKTGTLADNYAIKFFSMKFEMKDGTILKVPYGSMQSPYFVTSKSYGDYFDVSGSIDSDVRQNKVKEEVKKSSITGREAVVPTYEYVTDGYYYRYSIFLRKNIKIVDKIGKIYVKILNSNREFELIDEVGIDEIKAKDGFDSNLKKYKILVLMRQTKNFIKGVDDKLGDRQYLYVFQITIEDKDGNLIEELNVPYTSYTHFPNYEYVQGYTRVVDR